jgi:Na+/H+ antiporter NhaD/arsenite permease-like protein
VYAIGLISIIVFAVNLLFFYAWYKKFLRTNSIDAEKIRVEHKELEPWRAVTDEKLLKIALGIFIFTIGLLVFHSFLGLSVAFVGIFGATLVLVLGGRRMPQIITRIDWKVLIFFACLFIVVGGLEKTGVTSQIASSIGEASKGNLILGITLILWTLAFLSALVDNVPVAAVMVPVIRDLHATTGFPESTLIWTSALGTDIGGNATPIGASANVVGIAMSERDHHPITWKEYCKIGLPSMIVTIAVCNLLLILMYGKLF